MAMELTEDGCSLICQVQVMLGPDKKFFLRCDALRDSTPLCLRVAAAIKVAAEAELKAYYTESKS